MSNCSPSSHLSLRSSNLLSSAPEYLLAHIQNAADKYDPVSNPNGYLGLSVAENNLLFEEWMIPMMLRVHDIPVWSSSYPDFQGIAQFRSAMSHFLERRVTNRPIDASKLFISTGCGSVLDQFFHTVCEEGDAVLVCSPYYPGFDFDSGNRAKVNLVPVPLTPETQFRVSIEIFEEAMKKAEERSQRVRLLLISNPENPLGIVHSADTLRALCEWSSSHGLHTLVDEVYANCLHHRKEANFSSIASVFTAEEMREKEIHMLYGFSKDFGLSGFRVGCLYSENEEMISRLSTLGYFHSVSVETQVLLSKIVMNDEWIDSYLDRNEEILRDVYDECISAFDRMCIPYVPAVAGIFIWIDLSSFLSEISPEGERNLWKKLVDEFHVNLTPGHACHSISPGWFRFCFAAFPRSHVTEALRRLEVATSSTFLAETRPL